MDLRPFLREHVAGRPMIVGGALSLAVGLSLGSYLSAGELLSENAAPQVVVAQAETPQPIAYMTDGSGRIPDYVIGTDATQPQPLQSVDYAAWEPRSYDSDADDWAAPAAVMPVAEPPPLPVSAPTPPPSVGGDILRIDNPAPLPVPPPNAYAGTGMSAGG